MTNQFENIAQSIAAAYNSDLSRPRQSYRVMLYPTAMLAGKALKMVLTAPFISHTRPISFKRVGRQIVIEPTSEATTVSDLDNSCYINRFGGVRIR